MTTTPSASIAKMATPGIPLTDADRAPWLASLHAIAAAVLDRRRARRDRVLRAEGTLSRCAARCSCVQVRFVYLKADERTLRRRLEDRGGHFAGPALLASQLAALEEPADALTIDATRPPSEIVKAIA